MAIAVDRLDVLIIGAGPAGLTAANCFNGSNSLRSRIIDQHPGTVSTGKADGLKSISLEVLDTFGIGDAIRNESHRVEEVALWEPNGQGSIERTMTIADRVPELGKPREVTLDQGRIEHLLAKNLEKHGNVEFSWRTRPVDLQINRRLIDDSTSYPVTIKTEVIRDGVAHTQIIQAKHVIACDGARSWTRKHLDIPLKGDHTDSIWGVMDAVPKTNFPDIRKVCVIHSENGTVMAVPRESKLVRFYISMDALGFDIAAAKSQNTLTVDHLVDSARLIFDPYGFEVGEVRWWSAYQVGQRVAEEFARDNRVFLAGDAVHTHSPKAGQGMNTSIQDAYNIGWKLRFYLEQNCNKALLASYEKERRPIAQQLIDFDREYIKLFSDPELQFDDFLLAYKTAMRFTTGIGIQYAPSLIVKASGTQEEAASPAKVLTSGMRLPDFQMVNQSDGVPTSLYHRLNMNGKFRILVFAGAIAKPAARQRLLHFGEWLERFYLSNPKTETIILHSSPRSEVELMELPEVFRPWSNTSGWDYWRVYTDDESYHDGHGKAYERCGLSEEDDHVVIMRPDGYSSLHCGMNQTAQIEAFFQELFTPSSDEIFRSARL